MNEVNGKREAKLILERSAQRCSACPWARQRIESQRPRLVVARLNATAKAELSLRTGTAPQDQMICLNTQCGAAWNALKAIEPLTELLK